MRLFNTLTGMVEPLEPAYSPVRLYVCGVTPYDTTHLGHAFVYLSFDVLIRMLERRGMPVRYVQNVTDVDDPLFARARDTGEPWQDIVKRQMDQFLADLNMLGARPVDVRPYVSGEIPEMIAMIQQLEEGGYTYAIDDRVYFRVRKWPNYGVMGGLSRTEQIERSKDTGNDPWLPGKEDPLDFLLWRGSAPDEPAWDSPWGPGRPGWHVECSAMSLSHLGEQIDIHGGGADLIFPHHASEIAQSEATTGLSPFSRYWMHCGLVRLDGVKMSKSLGNLVFTRDLLGRYEPDAVRLYLLSHHYREGWDHDAALLDDCALLADHLRELVTSAAPPTDDERALERHGLAALEDDLNTPAAISILRLLSERGPEAAGPIREVGSALGLLLARD